MGDLLGDSDLFENSVGEDRRRRTVNTMPWRMYDVQIAMINFLRKPSRLPVFRCGVWRERSSLVPEEQADDSIVNPRGWTLPLSWSLAIALSECNFKLLMRSYLSAHPLSLNFLHPRSLRGPHVYADLLSSDDLSSDLMWHVDHIFILVFSLSASQFFFLVLSWGSWDCFLLLCVLFDHPSFLNGGQYLSDLK